MPAKEAPFIRFQKSYKICPNTGCWIWSNSKYPNGYGWLKVFGKVVSAHRFSYELYHGEIPDEAEILHSCDVKDCVNPDHLRAGTHAENMREAKDRNRMPKGENHPMWGKSSKKPKQSNKVLVLGVEYESQKSAERALGLGSGTVRYWILNSPEKAKIIQIGEYNARD